MSKRLYVACLAWITSTFLFGCQRGERERKTGMDVVQKPWPTWAVAFSPDGRWLAAGRGYRSEAKFWLGGKGEVNVWRLVDWKLQNGFSAPFTTYVQALTFTPNRKKLVAAATQYIQMDPKTGGPVVGTPNPHDGNMVFVWTVPDGSLARALHFNNPQDKRSDGFVTSVDIHPGGKLIGLSLAGSASVVLQWKTGSLVYEVENNGLWQNLAFSPDGKNLVSVLKPSLSPDGRSLASVQKPLVQLCDAGTGNKLAYFEPKFENPAQLRFGNHGYELVGDRPVCVCYTGDGKQIAVGISNGSVLLLKADLTKQFRSLQVSKDKEWVVGLASAPKTDLLAAATPSTVRLFEASSGKQLQEWGKADLRVSSVALSPDGKLLAAGHCGKHDTKGEYRGGYVSIWDTATGRLIKKLD